MGNFFDGPVIIFIIYAFIYLTFLYIKINNNITGKKHLSNTNSSRIFSIMKTEIFISFITLFFIGFLNIFNVHFLSWIIALTIIILSIYNFFQKYYVIFELNNKNTNNQETNETEITEDISNEEGNIDSNVNDLSDNILSDTDSTNIEKRINRDIIRKEFYDKVDNIYEMNTIEENKYDLSNNNIKYHIVNHELKMPSFYNPINYILKNLINNNFDDELSSYLYPNYNTTNYNTYNYNTTNYNIPNYNRANYNRPNYNRPNYNSIKYNNPINRTLNIPNFDNTNSKRSYNDKYDSSFYMDEIINYKNANFQKAKDLLTIQNPNISDIEINKYLDIEWKNLSDAEKSVWIKNT